VKREVRFLGERLEGRRDGRGGNIPDIQLHVPLGWMQKLTRWFLLRICWAWESAGKRDIARKQVYALWYGVSLSGKRKRRTAERAPSAPMRVVPMLEVPSEKCAMTEGEEHGAEIVLRVLEN
jgi:hypothetical protein